MPAQPVDHPGALGDDLIAVIAQHADLQRVLVGERHREALDPVAHHGQRDSARVDRIGLPGLARDLAGLAGHRGRHADHPLASGDQRGLQARGDVPAVLDRPHPLLIAAQRRTAEHRALQRRWPGSRAGLASTPVCPSTATRVWLRLWVSAPITIMCCVPSLIARRSGPSADTAQSGRCHAPIKSRRRSSVGDGRHSQSQSDHLADSDKESQPATDREPNRPAGQHRSTTSLSLSDKAITGTDGLPAAAALRRSDRSERRGRPPQRDGDRRAPGDELRAESASCIARRKRASRDGRRPLVPFVEAVA